MSLFDEVFKEESIYTMLFFDVKAVLAYPTLSELKSNNESLYKCWKFLTDRCRYSDTDLSYQEHAIKFLEFNKIVAITYASLYEENGEIKRELKTITNDSESVLLDEFMVILNFLSEESAKYNYCPTLCGHHISDYDIPLLIKRFLVLSPQMNNKKIPFILKRALNTKPWESGLIDTSNVWKFNGDVNHINMTFISNYFDLKRNVDLMSLDELSKYYWENINKDHDATIKQIKLQSVNQTNLTIQLMKKLREF